ncbi:hypothetical protein FACS1894125_6920 [Actinomycetota bacterium]|nr:hypothetical protein FACS1894125_6920 [Actinomycetota bacterium]
MYIGASNLPFVYRQNTKLEGIELVGYDKIGLFNHDKTVHFFLDDYRFDKVWDDFASQTKRLAKHPQVLGPDFSTYTDMPLYLQKYNVFKNRWCCAYWQKAGLAVVPTMSWSDEDSFEWCFGGIEKGTKVAVSTVGSYDWSNEFVVAFKEMIKQIDPEQVLVYGKLFEGMDGLVDITRIPYSYIKSDYFDESEVQVDEGITDHNDGVVD